MPLKTERRTQHRKRPLSLVYIELPPSNGGMMRDLSERGFSLRAMLPVSPSEKVPFSFVLDSSARIDGEAIVLRVEDGGHVAALEFAGLPSHSRNQIRRWLEKFDEPISLGPPAIQPGESKHLSFTELRSQIRAPKAASPAAPGEKTETPPPPPNGIAPLAPAPRTPQMVVEPTLSEPPHTPVLPAAENVSPPLPAPAEMSLTKPALMLEAPPATSPLSRSTIEQPEASSLPPLLKLSSVRLGPPAELSEEEAISVGVPDAAPEAPASISASLPKAEAESVAGTRIPVATPVKRAVPLRRLPPPLEPLSSLEGETGSESPGWMDRFTLGRAIGIMFLLTLLASSYVYHREVGQALIWLGQQIAGDDSPESSKVVRPLVPPAAQVIPESSSPTRAILPPPLTVQQPQDASEPKSANLPAAAEKTPSPQLKNAAPGPLVPLNQVTRPPLPTPPPENPADTGQQEYLEAMQILRSPGRMLEVPAAVRLLWAAVEKGNTGAEIDLAELFRTGRGVAKNCDQTRILLSAAARKGSTEARKRLEAFQREGCGND